MKTKRSSTPTASMTGEKTEENKKNFILYLSVFLQNHFAALQVAIFLFVRDETLRIANTDRTSMHPEESGAVVDRFA